MRYADEVRSIAHDLIPEHHRRLEDAPITYVFTDIKSGKGCQTWGKTTKVTGKAAFLASPVPSMQGTPHDPQVGFLTIEIDDMTWAALNDRERPALVDHELSHCGWEPDDTGIMKPVVVPHDVEEFTDVVARHGLWYTRLFDFAQTAREQLTINFPE